MKTTASPALRVNSVYSIGPHRRPIIRNQPRRTTQSPDHQTPFAKILEAAIKSGASETNASHRKAPGLLARGLLLLFLQICYNVNVLFS